jgi:prevent-host-death family protein
MHQVNVHQAKTHLLQLLTRVQQGEEIIIAKADVPIARLVPIGNRPAARAPGSAKGKLIIASDFDVPCPPSPTPV